MIRSYDKMMLRPTFLERFEYLRLDGTVGEDTFGHDRYMNQRFYRSREWRKLRYAVIARDNALDLASEDHPIHGRVYIHHINPLTVEELKHGGESLFDMNNLVCVSHNTHNAIHYGDTSLLSIPPVERTPGDTTLW